MPILEIEIVLSDDEVIDETCAQQTADAAGEIFGPPPRRGGTCVPMRHLPCSQCAENGNGDACSLRPMFVSVLKAQVPEAVKSRAKIPRFTLAMARIIERPIKNVYALYLPQGAGRIAFGGGVG